MPFHDGGSGRFGQAGEGLQEAVDLIASADADRSRRALRAVVRDPNVDGLVELFVSPVMIDADAVAGAIVEETVRQPEADR